MLVAGPSGSGKSSLAAPGLIPALKGGALPGSDRWLYTTLRPGRAPLDALGRALSALAGSLTPSDDLRARGLSDPTLLERWAGVCLGDDPNRRLLFLVDQFEEVFTQLGESEEAQRVAFLAQLTTAATTNPSRVNLVLTMRSDFVADCASFSELNTLLNQGFFQVRGMEPDELASAIARPAMEVGLRIDPDLVAQVISDMHDKPGALPLMQFALKDLFDYEAGQGGVIALTLAGYLEHGGLHQALERYADNAFAQLSSQEQELARSIFLSLVSSGRGAQATRRRAMFRELTPAGRDTAQVELVIRKLADARLITTEDPPETPQTRGGDDRSATLAHERMLQDWPWLHKLVDENRAAISLQNEIQEDALRWEASGRNASYLYAGARLETVREHVAEKRDTI